MSKSDKLKKCETCGDVFASYFLFAEHMNSHTGETPFLCPQCGDSFQTVKQYVQHARYYPDYHYVPCHSCNKNVYNKSALLSHFCETTTVNNMQQDAVVENVQIKDEPAFITPSKRDCAENSTIKDYDGSNRPKATKPVKIRKFAPYLPDSSTYHCDECSRVFMSKKQLRAHARKFPGKHTFTCNDCSKNFTSEKKLDAHLCLRSVPTEPFQCSCCQFFDTTSAFRAHIGTKPYTCCSCRLEFNVFANLVRHTRTHTQQKPYKCKFCSRAFTQASNLKNHISVHYAAMTCDQCDFTCKTPVGLYKHKRKHKMGMDGSDLRKISSGMHKCEICGKEFRFTRNLSMHLKKHSYEPSLCTKCGKFFENDSGLKKHLAMTHGPPVPCTVCGKIYQNSASLKNHMSIHDTSLSFECSVCSKSFTLKSYLTQHMKTHSSAKKYTCQYCDHKFKVVASFKYHYSHSCPFFSQRWLEKNVPSNDS